MIVKFETIPFDQSAYAHLVSNSYSVRRFLVDSYLNWKSAQLESCELVLDVGGHKPVSRGVFKPDGLGKRRICLNISSDKGSDVLGEGGQLPLASNSVDLILCSEVLEHVPDPSVLLDEMARVLIRPGHIILTVPFNYKFHADPMDYVRPTHEYWIKKFDELGAMSLWIAPQGEFEHVILEMLWDRYVNLNNANKCIKKIIMFARQWVIKRQSTRLSNSVQPWTTGYGIHARF